MDGYVVGTSRWRAGADCCSTATAGEEESSGTEVAELAVSWRYFLPENRKMGVAYLVSNRMILFCVVYLVYFSLSALRDSVVSKI